MQAIAALSPGDWPPNLISANRTTIWAATAFQAVEGKLDDAIAEFRQALALRPDSAISCNNLGTLLHNRGQHAEAVAILRRALELHPDFAEAAYNLGNALRALGEMDQTPSRPTKRPFPSIPTTQRPTIILATPTRAWANTTKRWIRIARHWESKTRFC